MRRKGALDPVAVAYGNRLSVAREAAGLTQEQVAEAAGLTVSTYRSYEKGRARVPVDLLPQLAEVFGRSLYWMHGLDDPRELSGDEQQLVTLYQGLRESARDMVMKLAQGLAANHRGNGHGAV